LCRRIVEPKQSADFKSLFEPLRAQKNSFVCEYVNPDNFVIV
jgi:hypothetical protein